MRVLPLFLWKKRRFSRWRGFCGFCKCFCRICESFLTIWISLGICSLWLWSFCIRPCSCSLLIWSFCIRLCTCSLWLCSFWKPLCRLCKPFCSGWKPQPQALFYKNNFPQVVWMKSGVCFSYRCARHSTLNLFDTKTHERLRLLLGVQAILENSPLVRNWHLVLQKDLLPWGISKEINHRLFEILPTKK